MDSTDGITIKVPPSTTSSVLQQTLNLLLHILDLDRPLQEELSVDGGHPIVTRHIHDVVPKLDTNSSSTSPEGEQDAREDLQDAIISIASCFRRSSSHRNTFIFTTEERSDFHLYMMLVTLPY